MSDKPKLYIVDIGMVTPVGANAEMTAAAVKAGISSFNESDFFDDDFNKIKMSCVPKELLDECLVEDVILGELQPRHARMLQLAKLALVQIRENIPKDKNIPLFLAGSESTSSDDPHLTNVFLENLANQSDIELDFVNSRIISTGRAGSLDAVDLAMRYLEVAKNDYVLVGAVDTFYEKNVLDYYLSNARLCTRNAMDGFVPGEGAAFLLLSKDQLQNNVAALPFILEPGLDNEEGHMFSDDTYTGSGLARAVAKAVYNSGSMKIRAIYSSMNGENYFSKELGVSIIRSKDVFGDDFNLLHPADCYGDLGAATGIVLIGMACVSLIKRQVTSSCIICCSSDSASRSAAVVSM